MKIEKGDKVVYLDGQKLDDDCPYYKGLVAFQADILVIDDVYDQPYKMEQIEDFDPKFLFLHSTGIYEEKIAAALEVWNQLQIPVENVLFGHNTEMLFLGLARKMKKQLGTRFFKAPTDFDHKYNHDEDELFEFPYI